MTTADLPAKRRGARRLPVDLALGLLAVVWTAEATVRLPGGAALTALVYAGFAARLLLTTAVWMPALLRGWPMLLYPLVCLASAFWSPVPQDSAVAAVQLLFTLLMGVYLGAAFGLAGLAGLVLTGLGLTMAASAANLGGLLPPAWSWEGGFLGVYTNKNALGQRAALLLLTLILFLSQTRGGARALWGLAAAATLALLVLSRSATSWVMALGAGGALVLLLLRAAGGRALLPLGIVAGTGTAALLAAVAILQLDPAAGILAALGKTATLTGRTEVWQAAAAQIGQRPLLGTGYLGFWTAPEHAREAQLLAALYGDTVASFHNFVLEILVGTGPLGLAAMVVLLGHAAQALLAAPRGPVRAWALVVLATLVLLSLLGSSLYRPHEITLLLVAALAAGAGTARRAASAPPDAR
ncbi:hypothetical protein GE300_13645 [Rhodobacteraceae bacterium 2CG4]|uniref:O-antigen ligase-related domain-containing protein n=1 Tax=Halovulum marinum TaxID=2662447 RepID=A0A6L5Z3U2_9RHOB|nr:O-antigen ligase family protein [Halovulum marinum]MSU90644.1 hypothetical protein [Halovulum marinum]